MKVLDASGTASGERILVIKLGALGDFVQAMGAFAGIRQFHANAELTLLTTKPFVDFGRRCGLFDQVWLDERSRLLRVGAWLGLRRRILDAGFRRVYDLQTSDRTGFYFRMLWPHRPEWSGVARGCSHPHQPLPPEVVHTIDKQVAQLRLVGIDPVPPTDLSWMQADLSRFALPERYVLLVPGAAPHRPAKRWPPRRYAELARLLAAQDLTPVVLGAAADAEAGAEIASVVPQARNLVGQTSLDEVAVLARGAVAAVGNDTGPMHLIAMSHCPSVVLFSQESEPAFCAPRGRAVTVLRRPDLADMPVEEVAQALAGHVAPKIAQ